MSKLEPQPESHWYPSHVEDQPPHDQVLSIQCLVQESRGRLGPGASVDAILADLRERGLEVSRDDLSRVWNDRC